MRSAFQRSISVFLLLCMLFMLLPGTAAGSTADTRVSTPRLEELIRAVGLGFGTDVDDVSQISYQAYFEMLDRMVELLAPDNLAAWQTKYPQARASTAPMIRASGMYLMYAAAHDALPETYQTESTCYGSLESWGQINLAMGDNVWNGYTVDRTLFPDVDVEETSLNNTFRRQINAAFFAFARRSVNGYSLFDYDSVTNSMRPGDAFTVQEAMWSVLRMVESIDPYTIPTQFVPLSQTGSYRTDIVTPQLLARAAYMPTPTAESLPYYTGIQHDWIPGSGSELNECFFRLYADLGFNYVRVNLSCRNFFGIDATTEQEAQTLDTSITRVDLACLTKLDELVSWGLKYGLHISIQFFDYPGHIQFPLATAATADTDFFTNETKQAQTETLWRLIAARYKGIPSSVLSFYTNHEPNNSARTTGAAVAPYTDEQIETACKRIINAVRETDPDRLQIYETTQFGFLTDDFMSDANVVQASVSGENNFIYWNLITDFQNSSGELPNWPLYEIPGILDEDKTELVIDGFLPAGTAFYLQLKDIYLPGDGTTVDVTADGVSIYHRKLENFQSEEIAFTLAQQTQRLVLSINEGGRITFRQFKITLPVQYAVKKDYYESTDEYFTGVSGTRLSKTSSEIEVKTGYSYATYGTAGQPDAEKNECWIFDASAQSDLTITEQCSYTSNYGLCKQAMQYKADKLAETGRSYLCCEIATNWYHTQKDIEAYLHDFLSVLDAHRFGWVYYNYQSLFLDFFYGCEGLTLVDGILMEPALLNVLQTYQAERPVIMTQVPHAHHYSAVVTLPTCMQQGFTTHTCACGETYIDTYTAALGHSMVTDAAVAATCTEAGLTAGSHCSRCDYTVAQQTVNALGHDMITDAAVAATCTETGLTEGSHCSRCDYKIAQQTVDALGHNLVTDAAASATCTESGLTEGSHCSRCDYTVAQQTVNALGHDLITDAAVAATCTESGLTEGSHCSRCDYAVAQQTVDALGHDMITDAAVAATCTESGLTEGSHCSRCDYAVAQQTVNALGHDIITDAAVAATCTESGLTEGSHCSRCDYTVAQQTVNALGHDLITDAAVAATCTESGLTEGSHCNRCDYTFAQQSVNALGHDWDDGVVTTAPTADAEGVKTYTCSRCDETKTESIAKLSVTFTDVPAGKSYSEAVSWAVANNITKGTSDTTFSPEATCTRGQIVTFLWRAAGEPKPTTSVNPFTDVKAGTSYYMAVLWAVEEGITSGTSSTTFSPSEGCTRGQVATFLWRAEGKPAPTLTSNPFTDVKTGAFYYNAVLWAVEQKITLGTSSTTFSPDKVCTRGQIVTFLYRNAK